MEFWQYSNLEPGIKLEPGGTLAMSIVLTYWERPKYGYSDDEDYDGLFQVHLKSVKQIPALIAARPPRCVMISTEHSAERTLRNGRRTNFFKQIWKQGEPVPQVQVKRCPLCGAIK